ncbi:hypothetical protein [Chryseobacterium sp. JUb7]|uniref:hypothetical protein n=1 Tax=Chryseobacterium sp. JUb7 TaxID=2940599 RepID=UPI00216A1376|nr:hypothetical protein [Chryseobacterium sp. JUb7]MCS3532586.1 hypothetical protein [Chryseobacterium sp. JUb7]
MKYILVGLICGFFLMNCQNKEGTATKENSVNDTIGYLNILIDKNINLMIGKFNSQNENINQDFKINKIDDTIYISKEFLESENIDGKKLNFKSNHKFEITAQYNVGYSFSGDEKKMIFLPINHQIIRKISSNLIIPSIDNIFKDIEFKKFEKSNTKKIKEQSYETFIKYYENIPETELKSCCITDFENYQKVKKINPRKIVDLELNNDLLINPDYKSLIINIKDLTIGKKYIIKFSKQDIEEENNIKKVSIDTDKLSNWDGIYWLYPYEIGSDKIGNYYINISENNNDFGFSGDDTFSYKINTKIEDNKLYIFDKDSPLLKPLAIIYKNKDNKFYLKSSLIKIERSDLKETEYGYPIKWAKSSDDVPNLPE